jgi:hypothetical protein
VGRAVYRDKEFTCTLYDLGDLAANRPRGLAVNTIAAGTKTHAHFRSNGTRWTAAP